MRYPGGKNGAGVYQRIINLMPPHRVYIEPFAGSAAVLRRKRAARSTIAIEIDADAARKLRSSISSMTAARVVEADGIEFLRRYEWRGDELVYCDPPYMLSTRRAGPIYKYEMSDERHAELLEILLSIPAAVMLSGYRSALYDETLRAWHRVDYKAMTRGGSMADESLWLNYRPPVLLHDTRFLGANFRERERIKRKRLRWVSNLLAMPPAERNAVYASLVEAMRAGAADPRAAAGDARAECARAT